MALLPILKYPDQRLKKIAQPVADDEFESLQGFFDDLLETMLEEDGAGLAATQVDVHKRVMAIGLVPKGDQRRILVNLEILSKEGTETDYEGCLSVPGVYEKVTRAQSVKVKAKDRFGNDLEFTADGQLAVCLQHENDHLNGILFIEHLSKLKLRLLKMKLEKLKRNRY